MTRIIPRFLYHLTNRANYECTMNSGALRVSEDILFGKGVFTAELTNLFKRWRKSPDWGGTCLQNDLLLQTGKDSSELVVLKIPTSALKTENIRIRSQNSLFREIEDVGTMLEQNGQLQEEYIDREMAKLDLSFLSEKSIQIMREKFKKEALQLYPDPTKEELLGMLSEHIKAGSSAIERRLFQQRKEAIEYIYTEDIPASQIEKIGEVNVDELRKTAEYDPLRPMRSIFSALLRGTPQEKGALLLNC